MKIKIGVFDSGIGGLSVVRAIQKELPSSEVVFKDDSENVPYGNRTVEEIYSLAKPVIQSLIDEGCEVVVIACNTVTTNLIGRLRREFSVPFVGIEPMIKPAASATRTEVIAVCATPLTLASSRYKQLKKEFAASIKVLEPDCSEWSYLIESNRLDREKIAKMVEDVCSKGADQIVLGCTHYHWIEEDIKELSRGRASVLQPEEAIIDQLKRVLAQLA